MDQYLDPNFMKAKSYFSNPKLDALLKDADVVVFDFNGTILDDEPIIWEAWNLSIAEWHSANRPGEPCPRIYEKDYGAFCIGRRTEEWMPLILGRPMEDGELDAVRKRKDELYLKNIVEKVREIVRPGVLELMEFLDDADVPMAIATSARWPILEETLGEKGDLPPAR